MGRILLFTTAGCSLSATARAIVRSWNVPFYEVSLSQFPHFVAELKKLSGSEWVPQLFLNELGFNSLDSIVALARDSAQLKSRLNECLEGESPSEPVLPEDSRVRPGPLQQLPPLTDDKLDMLLADAALSRMLMANPPVFSAKPKKGSSQSLSARGGVCATGKAVLAFLKNDPIFCSQTRVAQTLLLYGFLRPQGAAESRAPLRFKPSDTLDSRTTYVLARPQADRCLNARMERLDATALNQVDPIAQSTLLRSLVGDIQDRFALADGTLDMNGAMVSKLWYLFKNEVVRLQEVDLATVSKLDQKVFFINVYHVLFFHLLMEVGQPQTHVERSRFFNEYGYLLGGDGRVITLGSIDYVRLLRGFPVTAPQLSDASNSNAGNEPWSQSQSDPRVHFALQDSLSVSPPVCVLRRDNVEQALDFAARLCCSQFVVLDSASGTIYLHKIFLWYERCFGSTKAQVLGWLARFQEQLPLDQLDSLTVVYDTVDKRDAMSSSPPPSASSALASSASSSTASTSSTSVSDAGSKDKDSDDVVFLRVTDNQPTSRSSTRLSSAALPNASTDMSKLRRSSHGNTSISNNIALSPTSTMHGPTSPVTSSPLLFRAATAGPSTFSNNLPKSGNFAALAAVALSSDGGATLNTGAVGSGSGAGAGGVAGGSAGSAAAAVSPVGVSSFSSGLSSGAGSAGVSGLGFAATADRSISTSSLSSSSSSSPFQQHTFLVQLESKLLHVPLESSATAWELKVALWKMNDDTLPFEMDVYGPQGAKLSAMNTLYSQGITSNSVVLVRKDPSILTYSSNSAVSGLIGAVASKKSVAPLLSFAGGRGLSRGLVGLPAKFRVFFVDANGSLVLPSGVILKQLEVVVIQGTKKLSNVTITADSTCVNVVFVPERGAPEYVVHVFVSGNKINGSPFLGSVLDVPDLTECVRSNARNVFWGDELARLCSEMSNPFQEVGVLPLVDLVCANSHEKSVLFTMLPLFAQLASSSTNDWKDFFQNSGLHGVMSLAVLGNLARGQTDVVFANCVLLSQVAGRALLSFLKAMGTDTDEILLRTTDFQRVAKLVLKALQRSGCTAVAALVLELMSHMVCLSEFFLGVILRGPLILNLCTGASATVQPMILQSVLNVIRREPQSFVPSMELVKCIVLGARASSLDIAHLAVQIVGATLSESSLLLFLQAGLCDCLKALILQEGPFVDLSWQSDVGRVLFDARSTLVLRRIASSSAPASSTASALSPVQATSPTASRSGSARKGLSSASSSSSRHNVLGPSHVTPTQRLLAALDVLNRFLSLLNKVQGVSAQSLQAVLQTFASASVLQGFLAIAEAEDKTVKRMVWKALAEMMITDEVGKFLETSRLLDVICVSAADAVRLFCGAGRSDLLKVLQPLLRARVEKVRVRCVVMFAGLINEDFSWRKALTLALGKDFVQSYLQCIVSGAYDPREVHINPSELVVGRLVGRGVSGSVYSAQWRGSEVAVKMLNEESLSFSLKEFLSELALMALIRHPNVAHALGGSAQHGHYFIVSKFYHRGALDNLIRSNPEAFTTRFQFTIALHVARAMKYLHALSIIHRDLKPANVLVDTDWNVAVTDFGVSRCVDTLNMTRGVGTPLFAAPEVLDGTQYDASADVYSYGITMWQAIHLTEPYSDQKFLAVIPKIINEGLRPPVAASNPYAKLLAACWHVDPKQRPTFADVVFMLRSVRVAVLGEAAAAKDDAEEGRQRGMRGTEPHPLVRKKSLRFFESEDL